MPIASFFCTTPDQVRCEISRATQLVKECDDSELLQSYFSHSPSGTVNVDTNGEFIAAIAERVCRVVTG